MSDTSRQKVQQVMRIWRIFVNDYGKHGIYANVLWKWPAYLREALNNGIGA